MKRLPLVASFLLFLALCASAAYWGMQMFRPPLRQVAAPPPAAQADIRPEAATGLFGGRRGAASVAVASNYQLKGVIFSGRSRDSVAILSADGKPAQAVRVDMEVVPGVTVKEVHREYVLLSEGGATKRVELPEEAKGQGSVTMAPPVARPVVPPPAQPVPSRAQAAMSGMPTPSPVSPSAQVPPVPAAPLPGVLPNQAAGQNQGQVPVPTQSVIGAGTPPTVVVSPPPSGAADAAQATTQPPVLPQSNPAAAVQGTPQPIQQGTIPVR